MLRNTWLCGASCAAMIAATAAQAQTAAAPASPGLETVVVTATKVRANVQKVPIAIQTIAGRAITSAGVQDAKDLNRLVSSISVQNSAGGGSSFYIRGVGNDNSNANGDNGIAVSLDQVYFSRAYGPDLVFYDIDRIEVLKGPQGTLYGRNSTGGAVNIISTKPTIGKFDGSARLELGNYGEIRSNAAVNLPLSPTVAVRVAMQTDEHDGYMNDGYNDAKTRGVRVHLLWRPTTDFSLLVSAEYDHAGGKGNEPVPYQNNQFFDPSNPYAGGASPEGMAFVAANTPPPPFGGRPPFIQAAPGSCYPGCLPAGFNGPNATPPGAVYQITQNGYVDVTLQSLRADLEWNLGFGTLSVIPALLNTYYSTIFHNGPPPFFNDGSARQQSIEARIASPQDQRFTWLAGVFGQQEKQNFTFIGGFGFPLAYQGTFEPDVEDHAAGVFAQTNFKILDNLTLVTGARYSDENKLSRGAIADNANSAFPGSFVLAPVNKQHSASPTYRIGLDWQVQPDNLLYVSFATGFHSGGVQIGQAPTHPICKPDLSSVAALIASIPPVVQCDASGTYLPEKLKAYTIGSKNRFFDNRLQINLEAYDWEYTDLQVGTIGLSNPGQTNQVVVNAGGARIRGFDVEARVQITPDDQAGIALNYNKSKYGTLEYFNYIAPFPPSISIQSGQTFGNAPDLTFTANYSHIFNFASGATLTPAVSAQYSSVVTYSISPLETQPAYYKIDLNLTYVSPKDNYEIQLFARNVTNKITLNGGGGTDQTTQLPYVFLGTPRTFGGSVQVNF